MRPIACLLLVGCLTISFATLRAAETVAGEPAEAISPKELRELLKEEKNQIGPAGEWLFGLSAPEREKWRELYQRDPAAARTFILEKLEANRQRKQENAREIQRVARQLRQSGDETAKAQLRGQLRRLLTEQFEQTSAEIAVRLKMQEQRLAEVRNAYRQRLENADSLIDAQLEKLIRKRPAATPRKKTEKVEQ